MKTALKNHIAVMIAACLALSMAACQAAAPETAAPAAGMTEVPTAGATGEPAAATVPETGHAAMALTAEETEAADAEAETVEATTAPMEAQESKANANIAAPVHTHSYAAAETVAPTCSAEGYTVYACACGDRYQGDTVPTAGHCFGEWVTTEEATVDTAGEQTRACSACGAVETRATEKLPGEVIDVNALISYGVDYAVSTYGFTYVPGTRAGYFPAVDENITTMEEGRSAVRANVDMLARDLIAMRKANGNENAEDLTLAYFDIRIEHDRDSVYWVNCYYG